MIVLGLGMALAGLGTLFAMLLQMLPVSLWLALVAYAASFSGVFMAGLELAAHLRR